MLDFRSFRGTKPPWTPYSPQAGPRPPAQSFRYLLNLRSTSCYKKTFKPLRLQIIVIKLLALLFMSNKIKGKNYSLSFILVNGYINRLNPIHKHTFDLVCLYNHLMIYSIQLSFSSILTGVPVCSIIFSHLVIQYTVLDLVNCYKNR